jgi:hypothetical protein
VSRLVQQQDRVRLFALDLSPSAVPGGAAGSAAGVAAVGLVPALIAILRAGAAIPPPTHSPNAALLAVCCKVCDDIYGLALHFIIHLSLYVHLCNNSV